MTEAQATTQPAPLARRRRGFAGQMARLVDAVTNPAERRVFAMAGLLAFVVAVGLPFTGYSMAWLSTLPTLGVAAMLFAVGCLYRTVRPDARLAAMAMGTCALLLFSMFMALTNYIAIRLDRPFIDATLAAWDRMLGIDWHAALAWVQSTPLLKLVLSAAYVLTLPQIAFVVVLLALSGRLERLSLFTLAFSVSALITVAYWAAFPSFGAFAHYREMSPAFSDAGLIVDGDYARELYDLKSGAVEVLSIDKLTGLIAFPSFHTAIAVLAAYALWPVRFVGGAALVLNMLIVLSVPFDGGHHFVDVPAGIAVAVAGLAIAGYWLRRASRAGQA
jgi:hypothetical protein